MGGKTTEIGRTLKQPDLEMLGPALEGLALVSEGRASEGMGCLDEVTAAATAGDLRSLEAMAWAIR